MKKKNRLRILSLALLTTLVLPTATSCINTPAEQTPPAETTVSSPQTTASIAQTTAAPALTTAPSPTTMVSPVTTQPIASPVVKAPDAIPGAANLIGELRCSTTTAKALGGGVYAITATKGAKTNIDFKFDPVNAAEYDDAFIGFYVRYSEAPTILRSYLLGNLASGGDTHTGVKYGGYVRRSEEDKVKAGEWCWIEIPLSVYRTFEKGACYCKLGSNQKHDIVAPLTFDALCGFQFQFDDSVAPGAKANISAEIKDLGIYTYQTSAADAVAMPDCNPLSTVPQCTGFTPVDGVYTIPVKQGVKTSLEFTFPAVDTAQYLDAFIGFHMLYNELPAYLRAYVIGTVDMDEQTHTAVRFGDHTLRGDAATFIPGKWCWVEIPLSAFEKIKGSCTCALGEGKRHTVSPYCGEALTAFQIQFDDMSKPTLGADTQILLMNAGLYTYQQKPVFVYQGDVVPAAFRLSRNLHSTTTAPAITATDNGFTLTAPQGKTSTLTFAFDAADLRDQTDAFVGFSVRTGEPVNWQVSVAGASGKSAAYAVPAKSSFDSEAWRWVEIPLSALSGAASLPALSEIILTPDASSAKNNIETEIRHLGIYSYRAAEALTSIAPAPAGHDISENYEWDHILMGCYGFVNGMVMHPKDPNLIYAWTDVGGMYRWDAENQQWIQLMAVLGLENTGLKSVRSVALDPNDTSIVYAACGGKTDMTDIIKSTDQGRTWTFTNFSTKMAVGSEKILCGNVCVAKAVGDALVIDPNNSSIMYFGTQDNGFYRSTDQGENWVKITDIPDTGWPKGGVANVYINPAKVKDGCSTDIYVSMWGYGIYKSTDCGLTFTLIEGSPRCPGQVQVIVRDGKERMYVSSLNPNYVGYYTGTSDEGKVETDEAGSFYMYEDGKWTDLHPARGRDDYAWFLEQTSFSSFLIDSRNPDLIMLNTAPWNVRGSYLWRSTDGGMTFERVCQTYQSSRFIQDPLNPDGLWFPYGGGIRYIENFATIKESTEIISRSTGVETICATTMASLPGTADAPILLIISQDHSIRVQEELREQAPDNAVEPKFNHGGGIDFCEGAPTFVLRAGVKGRHNLGTGSLAYSTDSGRTFTAITGWDETMRLIDCAVGAEKQANGFPILMVASVGRDAERVDGSGVYRSLDGGVTWDYISVIPSERIKASHEFNNRLLASDRVNPHVFYYVEDQALWRTADGGDSWVKLTVTVPGMNAKLAGGRNAIKCVPGKEGHVWVKGADGVIFTSTDFGQTWSTLSGIEAAMSHACSFGFGIGRDPAGDPAVYVTGYVNGVLGCYLSDDMGRSWTKINPASQQFFAGIVDVVGDRRVYGRVFISTGGNGVLYAQLEA